MQTPEAPPTSLPPVGGVLPLSILAMTGLAPDSEHDTRSSGGLNGELLIEHVPHVESPPIDSTPRFYILRRAMAGRLLPEAFELPTDQVEDFISATAAQARAYLDHLWTSRRAMSPECRSEVLACEDPFLLIAMAQGKADSHAEDWRAPISAAVVGE